jgi:hypothetical protein
MDTIKILEEIRDDFVLKFNNDPMIKRVCNTIIAEYKTRTKQLSLVKVMQQSEQLTDHKCKFYVNADWTYLRCECGKRIKPKG